MKGMTGKTINQPSRQHRQHRRLAVDPAVVCAVQNLLADAQIMASAEQELEKARLRFVRKALKVTGSTLDLAQTAAVYRRYLQLRDPAPQRINLDWVETDSERVFVGTDDNQIILLDPSWCGEDGYYELIEAPQEARENHVKADLGSGHAEERVA